MPQLDTSTYITQMFWLVTTFISLWFIMEKVIIPKIAEMVEMRKRKYNDYIAKAEELNKKASTALEYYEEKLAVAKAKAAEQIAQNEQDLQVIITQKEQDINQSLKQKIQENEEKLSKDKVSIINEIDNMSQKVAYSILQRLNIESINFSDIQEISERKK